MLSALKLLSVKLSAGVLVEVATLVVNNGERFPAENDVTVPPPLPVPQSDPVALNTPAVSCTQNGPPVMLVVSVPVAVRAAAVSVPVKVGLAVVGRVVPVPERL